MTSTARLQARCIAALLALLASALLVLAQPAAAAAADHGAAPAGVTVNTTPDNVVTSTNTTNGSTVFNIAFGFVKTLSAVIDNGNAAVAMASCTSCETVAIAIQVVFVMNPHPSTFTPQNIAIAYNQNCVSCATLASAYQFVVQVSPDFHFTRAGMRELAAITRELAALRTPGLTIQEIQQRLDGLMVRLSNVLAHEIVNAAREGERHQHDQQQPRDNGTSGTPPPTDTTGTQPSPTDTTGTTATQPTPPPSSTTPPPAGATPPPASPQPAAPPPPAAAPAA